jgi:glycosyltransferase involved in cell wall biosynthesis
MIITVGIIAYNEKNKLGLLLKDICAQTYDHKKIEVILVDSNSTDNTKRLWKPL